MAWSYYPRILVLRMGRFQAGVAFVAWAVPRHADHSVASKTLMFLKLWSRRHAARQRNWLGSINIGGGTVRIHKVDGTEHIVIKTKHRMRGNW